MAGNERQRDENYRELLGERIDNAYRNCNNKKPGVEDFSRWQELARSRSRQKQQRRKAFAGIASVFLLALCAGAVALLPLPDVEAGEDKVVDIEDSRNEGEGIVHTYKNQEDLPEHVKSEFLMFPNLPEGCEVEEINIVSVGEKLHYEGTFKYKEAGSFTIMQRKNGENEEIKKTTTNQVEVWDEVEVHIKEYTNGENQISYSCIKNDIFLHVMSDSTVEKDIIKDILKEAV